MNTPNDWSDAPDWLLAAFGALTLIALAVYAVIGIVRFVKWTVRELRRR